MIWLICVAACGLPPGERPRGDAGATTEGAHPPPGGPPGTEEADPCEELRQVDARLQRLRTVLAASPPVVSPEAMPVLVEAAETLGDVQEELTRHVVASGVQCAAAPGR